MKGTLHLSLAIKASKALFSILCAIAMMPALLTAQQNTQNFWQDINESAIAAENNQRMIVPQHYRTVRLDLTSMSAHLANAPKEANLYADNNGQEISLPNPDGTFSTFKIWYSPVMAPALAAQYPQIRTYSGYNVAQRSMLVKLDVTPHGFHAMTYGGGNSVFIDPYAAGNTQDYIAYYKRDFVKQTGDRISCTVDEDMVTIPNTAERVDGAEFVGDCGIRHEFRLALAGTGEYTTFHGGTVTLALAAMNTTMNRVNGVFEKDVASRMLIVPNNNLLIYTNAGTDPYTNGDPNLMINENQTNTDAVIGTANYDIGHVFGTNSGGLAGLGVVCSSSSKARGVTGSGAPVGDPFDIDYVAHEMGHQFNGNHTQYNNCNRNNATAVEPGSASTIMGYAGICAPDVQANSDDYFSTASLFEMRPFVAARTCDVEVTVSNSAPTVTALNNYNIPISTPFFLTASATDATGSLTYCWEQINGWTSPAQTMPPASTNTTGPMFRSLDPVTSPTRYFPNLTDLFANVNPTWEELPSIGRAMNFRVTARDNFATAGCTGEASNTVTTVAGAGPFLVTSPNTAVSYAGNSTQTVTWDVAGTTAAPISCANVDILLTTDGGATFTTLASATPNDGTQSVTMPNINTTTARVWVRCSDNIFFDVSNVNFTISAVTAACSELFISEYVEGSSNNKAIEIYNPTSSTVTLTGNYSLRHYFNGSATPTNVIPLTGTIAPYGVFVVVNSSAGSTLLATANLTSTSLTFNGDDAVELYKVSTTTAVDIIGQIGLDPGTEWGTGTTSTADNTIRRKSSITVGDNVGSNAFDPSIEWDGFATDDFTGIGAHASACQPACSITAVTVGTPGSCNNNGTPSNSADDYYVADVTVTYSGPPSTGTLTLTGDVVAGGGSLSASAPFTTTTTFTGVRIKADNTPTVITATFSANTSCTFTLSNGPTVPSCSSCPTITAVISGTGAFCGEGNLTDVPVAVAISGGTGPYTVIYNNGVSNTTINNYVSGTPFTGAVYGTSTYTLVSVTDANGCTATLSGSATVIISPSVNFNGVITQPTCAALNGGAIDISLVTGTAPFTYLWSNGATTQDISGLSAGTYTVTTTDAGTCQDIDEYIIVAPTGCPTNCNDFSVSVSATNEFCVFKGSVTALATGGMAPYSYTLTGPGGYNQTNATGNFPNLSAGLYSLTVTDANTVPCSYVNSNINILFVPDNTPPVLTCPGPQTVSCPSNVPAPNASLVTVVENCQPPTPTATFTSDVISNQTCANRYTITRTYSATNPANLTGTCTQTITVNDQTGPVFNQSPLPSNTSITCTDPLPIAPMLTGTDGCGGGTVPNVIWINEFHYDNSAANDPGEFVEVAGTAGINLSDYQIILYNGNGGVTYNTTTLSGTIDNEGGSGFGAVSYAYPLITNGSVQNGAPDGIALYQISSNTVIQFLSYEGTFTATNGPATGMLSVDVGVSETNTTPPGSSIQLTGTGSMASNFTWSNTTDDSPGVINPGQTIVALPTTITATLAQTQTPGNCSGSRIVTRTWTLTDVCGNTTTHVQTININDTQPPVLTPAPPNVTVSCNELMPAPTVIATDDCDPNGIINGPVWINEIHYDNAGVDVNEFIEVAGLAGVNLAGWTLWLYNGTGGGTYNSYNLSGVIPNQSNGYGTLAFPDPFPSNVIQNGAPDGIALVNGGTVIQFLSYEGTMTAVGGPANGILSTDIGVSETGTEPVGQSLHLSGNGTVYANFTWNAPAAATPGAVNQGQTFPVQPPVGFPVTFTEVSTPPSPSCPYARTITRTWKATDGCGNTAIHTQVITVADNTPPTVVCKNITIDLPLDGDVSVTSAQVFTSASDNCTDVDDLSVNAASILVDCDDEGTDVPFTITVTDECGNTGSCTATITVNPFPRCTPVILISDPCVCKNNATTLTDGQFGEQIKIESLTGMTWTVTAVSGLYSASSPNPPLAPLPITVGTVFVENPVGSGDYYLNGIHIDAIGYTITATNQRGQTLSIGNSCQYPNPTITSNLSGPFCLYSNAVPLTGTPGDNNIVSQGFTINGVPATTFDPGAGLGQYTIVYTVDGGDPKAANANDPGCIQSVTQIVNVVATPSQLTCNNLVYVSLDIDCVTEITPDMVLEGTYFCYDDYMVELDKTLPLGNGPWVGAVVNASDIGKTYQTRVTHLVSGNKCWGTLKVEDKLAPELACEDVWLTCANTIYTPEYIENTLNIDAGIPDFQDCQAVNLTHIDGNIVDLACNAPLVNGREVSAYFVRKWTAADASGNTATCEQTIYFERLHIADLVLPTDVTVNACENPNVDPAVTGAPKAVAFGQNYPLYPGTGFCELQTAYVDQILPVCDGTFKVVRTWTLVDWCQPFTNTPPFGNPLYHTQIIKVVDDKAPVFTCPANLTVSTEPFNCCGVADLPDVLAQDACSRINDGSAMIAVFDPFTGAQIDMIAVDGHAGDFPNNNWWTPDTMVYFGNTPCLPLGTHTVTYSVIDDCGNNATCSFKLKVEDLIPPDAVCTEVTQVSLGTDGEIFVAASAFDQGSTDNCGPVWFKARRMDSNGCQSNNTFRNEVKFCCSDVGDSIQVVLRVYDVNPGSGNVSLDASVEHSNECMIWVVVDDKLKPTCTAPLMASTTCELFDESLWAYGQATATDNCCLDTIITTVNRNNFDTVCNKGTITRTFRAVDCYGNTSTCTQRIIVTYEQDYFVKFPNDRIVTVCDGTGNYGAPEFFGEDCELLGVSFEDVIFTVVPDACFKIERTWQVINWCTYNPNLPCVYVPNPNPSNTTNAPANLTGPIVSACGTPQPWNSTVIKINPTDPLATDYCSFYNANANCYQYKQIIKVIDTQDPSGTWTLPTCETQNWYTANDAQFWNDTPWWDATHSTHDLCEEPTDLSIQATDACSGANVNVEYTLFLDLDGDGVMETIINSTNLPGFNRVYFGNNDGDADVTDGDPRSFDFRPVLPNQKWGFAIREDVSGTTKTASVRWWNQQQASVAGAKPAEIPQLPHGTHKIKWFISDGCGNDKVEEYTFTVKDCKAPTVVCLNGLSVNIMPTGMIQLWASDFLQYTEDNCTPNPLKLGIRKSGTGTGFPVDANGNPITSVTFTCDELGTQFVELWAIDAAGNADYCETYVLVQDNAGNCAPGMQIDVAGALKTETNDGLEEGGVELTGTHPALPPVAMFDLTNATGNYTFNNAIPVAGNYVVTPTEDDQPLNGVSTYDLVLISKHILGIETLNSPYKMIAADANKSGSITTFDIVELRKLLLGIYQVLPNNTSWRFVDKSFSFPNAQNPFQTQFPENIAVADAQADQLAEDFVSVKVGDVNGSAQANSLMQADDRTAGTLLFDVADQQLKAGEETVVTFKASDVVAGYQFTMGLNGLKAVSVQPISGDMSADNFAIFDDAVTTSFNGKNAGEFAVTFRAEKAGKLSEMLQVSSRITKAEAYNEAGRLNVAFRYDGKVIAGQGFELYQNVPNPFVAKTQIGFYLPEATTATLRVFDASGRVVWEQSGAYAKGQNSIWVDRAAVGNSGILYYTLETETNSATKKMIQTK